MDISVFGLGTVAAITVLCYLVGAGVKTTPMDNKYIPGHLRRHWPCAWPCSPVCGHAGVPGDGPHHGGGCRRGVRTCGHGHQSGYETAWQN